MTITITDIYNIQEMILNARIQIEELKRFNRQVRSQVNRVIIDDDAILNVRTLPIENARELAREQDAIKKDITEKMRDLYLLVRDADITELDSTDKRLYQNSVDIPFSQLMIDMNLLGMPLRTKHRYKKRKPKEQVKSDEIQ